MTGSRVDKVFKKSVKEICLDLIMSQDIRKFRCWIAQVSLYFFFYIKLWKVSSGWRHTFILHILGIDGILFIHFSDFLADSGIYSVTPGLLAGIGPYCDNLSDSIDSHYVVLHIPEGDWFFVPSSFLVLFLVILSYYPNYVKFLVIASMHFFLSVAIFIVVFNL